MGKNKKLSPDKKQAIWNLVSYFQQEADRGRPLEKSIYKKVKRALKTSESSVKRVMREGKLNGGNFNSSTGSGQSRRKKWDQFTLGVIRRRIHRFYQEGQLPTLKKIYAALKEESPEEIPFGITTLWGLVKYIGFEYKKVNDNR